MSPFERTTEQSSNHHDLEKMSIRTLLESINDEDSSLPSVLRAAIPSIEALIAHIVPKMRSGGRLFYIGAGTSGRLGILDASECPPTYGVPNDWVVGIIAGGDVAIRKAVENAEDSHTLAWKTLSEWNIDTQDVVIGLAASGTTPYVKYGLMDCQAHGITTGCIVCNIGSPIAQVSDFPIEVVTGPEFVTGSTRMKAGTAQKLALNMISTAVMIQLGRVKGNKMVDMQLSNEKLVERGVHMVMEATKMEYDIAKKMLLEHGSVRNAIEMATRI